MRLVAEVVDRFSGPMRDMQKSLRALSNSAKSTHQTNTAHVRDQAKAYAGLDQSVKQIRDRTKSMLVPALAAAGVSILSVGAAVAAIVKATQSFGEATKKLSFMSRETGLTIAKLRELDELAKRVGTTPEAMRAGEQAFASTWSNSAAGAVHRQSSLRANMISLCARSEIRCACHAATKTRSIPSRNS